MTEALLEPVLTSQRNDKSPILHEVIESGRERLYPRLTDPNWLVLKERRKIFDRWLATVSSGYFDVLDVGGRIQPYRPLMAQRVQRYVSVDPLSTQLVSVMARGEQLPLPDSQFDLAICTQVLQYIAEPSRVIHEIYRVLRPGGVLLLSVPSACATDSSTECWRFLPEGLRHLLARFTRVKVVAEGSSVAGFFRTVNVSFDIFVRYPALRFVYRRTLCPLLNLTGMFLEKLSGRRNQQFSVNYSVLAEK
jgi:SAM-dependent methyltransferase